MIKPKEIETALAGRFIQIFKEKDIDLKVSTEITAPSESVNINARIEDPKNFDNIHYEYKVIVDIDFKSAYDERKRDRLDEINETIYSECLLDCWLYAKFNCLNEIELEDINPIFNEQNKKFYANKQLTLLFRSL